MHVRGFTAAQSSGVEHPGTYLGVIEKIPYLQSLGVTAVELMPVHEFPIERCLRHEADAAELLGLRPAGVLRARTAATPSGDEPGCQVREFKEMVLALHQAGIEVILDVVFNHTAEGNETGPTLSFKGLENHVYYMLENGGGTYTQLLRLRQHAQRQPPDRPRDDLPLPAALGPQLPRRRLPLRSGVDPQPQPRRASWCPIRRWSRRSPKTRCWPTRRSSPRRGTRPAAYQVGTFASLRWAEWNGHYRDDVRRFWRGDSGHDRPAGHAAGRLERPVPGQRPPAVPQHQLHHLARRLHAQRPGVSYSEKHNEANGEEQPRRRQQQLQLQLRRRRPDAPQRDRRALRLRQIKNMLASLLLSQGVPMLVWPATKCRRTQRGNNNAYCQDNAISWFDWKLVEKNAEPAAVLRRR